MQQVLKNNAMKRILLFAAIFLLLASCTENDVKELKTFQLSPVDKELIGHCNDFSFGLLSYVAQHDECENIVLSPLSASMLIGMLMNGADGETLAQMQEVTGFEADISIDDINTYYRQLMDVLPDLDQYTKLGIANGLWARENFPIMENFMNACKQNFDAQVKNVSSFTDEQVIEDINHFVAQQTNKRIKEIISREMISDNTVMVLLNALYFKALWKDKFDKNSTRTENFTTIKDSLIQTPLMCKSESWKYGETDEYQFVELPYKGSKYCADIILPAQGINIRNWIQTLNAESWIQMLSSATYWPEVILYLPKFQLSYERELTEDMQSLGMKDAFSAEKANFSLLSEYPTYVDLIKQKTFLQVDEEGTEAAVVTIGEMEATSAGPDEWKTVRVDRPFLFIIRESEYGTILFTALIGHPNWQD